MLGIKTLCALLLLIPISSKAFDVSVSMKGFNKEQQEKIFEAIELIKKIVKSPLFKEAIINKSFNDELTFNDNNGLTNEEIYQKILEGKEVIGSDTTANGNMDLELVLYRDERSNTIGFTYPHIPHIYMNEKFLEKFESHEVANNLFHEWLHKIGFNHSVEKTPHRVHSVPYAIGYLVKDMAYGLKEEIAKL